MVTFESQHLNLNQIASSGQCFTWRRLGEGRYLIPAQGRTVEAVQAGDRISLLCAPKEFESVWRDYFDLDTDYGAFLSAIPASDPCLTAAARLGQGIRILRQDFWEVMVSFLISQNNNIARITRSVAELCRICGAPLENGLFSFPTPDALAARSAEDFRAIGLGYRAEYLANLSATLSGGGEAELRAALEQTSDEEARCALMSLRGIGRKVADCILLFGLHRLDAFPTDTHIKRVLCTYYPDGFPFARYRGFAGVIQQYLFYFDL